MRRLVNRTDTMYCHSIVCPAFNEPQEYRFIPASWDGPAENIDDHECRECYGDVHDHAFEPEEMESAA